MKKNNKVEQIMENYRKGIEKIDKQYDVKEVKEIDTKVLDEKIEYEKSFIEKLETQGRDENVELINRAKERLETALKEKTEKTETYEKEKAKREEKLNNVTKLKNSKVVLPSGREVTKAEKDEMDKNDLKDKAIRELTQESNKISDELVKKNKELEAKREEWNNFKYEFEKDENGNSTGKTTNDADIIRIHKEYDDIKKEMIELNKMQESCNKYLEEFRQKDNEKMKNFSEIWNEYRKGEDETNVKAEKTTDNKSDTEQETESETQNTTDSKSTTEQKTENQTTNVKPTTEQETENQTTNVKPTTEQEIDLDDLGEKIIRQTEKMVDETSKTEESQKDKPEIIISRKPTISCYNYNVRLGSLRKIMKQKPEQIMSKLQKVLPNKKIEDLEKISERMDPVLLEGIIQLREKNMLTNKEISEAVEKFDNDKVTEEGMEFKVTYDMKDLSKGAFLPWNRKDRDKIAELAEDNKERGIAKFKDGYEYEPNPIKRMLKIVKRKKIDEGKEKESGASEFKKVDKERFYKNVRNTEKSEYEQIMDNISKVSDDRELEEIVNKAKKAVMDKKISPTELSGILNNIKFYKERLKNEKQTDNKKEKEEEEEYENE